jgi:hypothetical protein
MAHREHPEDFNTFGYNPRGQVANIIGFMFGAVSASNISLTTTAHRLHHLNMARPQTQCYLLKFH